MLPSIFANYYAQDFSTFGIGVLSDAISCFVEEERNSSYELEMEYPVTGKYYEYLKLKNIITARANYSNIAQPFRIYYISRPLRGVVTVHARHLSYDLSGFIAYPFTASSLAEAMTILTSNQYTSYSGPFPFTISSDMTSTASMRNKLPQSVRSLMGGVRGSMLDVYGGEWSFNVKECSLLSARGQDRGVVIQYGKNLTALQETEEDTMYHGIVPYYYNADTEELVYYDRISTPGLFLWHRDMLLDLTEEFDSTPTQNELYAKAIDWQNKHDILAPSVNLKLNFIQIDKYLDRVDLCDTVTINYDDLGVSTSAKCIRLKWNVLLNRPEEIEIGTPKLSIGDFFQRVTPEHYYVGSSGGGG